MVQLIRNSMRDQMNMYVFVSVLFVVGVVFGALMVNALSLEQQQELGRYLGNFVTSIDQKAPLNEEIAFWQMAMDHVKWVAVIFILGLSVIGLPLILILDFLKGVLIGFTVGYLVGQFSWKGLLFALVSVAPQNLIVIPALMICSVAAISFSLYIIRNRVVMHRRTMVKQPFLSYVTLTLTMAVTLVGMAVFETWVSPVMMQWVTPMLRDGMAAIRI